MLRRLITSSVRAPVARTVATRSFSVVAARRGEGKSLHGSHLLT
jgi:hypothetical protein